MTSLTNNDVKVKGRYYFVILFALLAWSGAARAQQVATSPGDSIQEDTTALAVAAVPAVKLSEEDSLKVMALDSTVTKQRKRRDWNTWKPDPKRALWLSLIIPGAGQIYNRKYWKLPIVYGGFVGCAYALTWNNQMYHDYSQAYMDIMDNDPTTQSYNQFLHLGVTIDEANKEYYQELFRKRKDRYRRWRDMSVFVMIGIYALSVIDAYVDASLSEFDISDDLSFPWSPR